MLWNPAFLGATGARPVVSSALPTLGSPVQGLDATDTDKFFTDAAGTAAAGNGSLIARVNDSFAGGTWFFRQQTQAERPTLVTNAVNGKPVLRFNGTASWMALQNATTGFANAGERFRSLTFTLLACFRIPDAQAVVDGSGVFAAGSSTGGEGGNAFDNLTLQALGSGWPAAARHSGSEHRNINISGAGTVYAQNMKVILRGSPANGMELMAKCAEGTATGSIGLASSADSFTWDFAAIGAEMGHKWGTMPSNRLRFDLMELRFWNVRASDAERTALIAYLDNKWGN